MLAPRLLVATGPSTPIAAAVSRVVVVLPLVPEISAISRPAASSASRLGSIMRPIRPPMTDPSPRPVARDSAAAPRDSEEASLARIGSLLSVISRFHGLDGVPLTLPGPVGSPNRPLAPAPALHSPPRLHPATPHFPPPLPRNRPRTRQMGGDLGLLGRFVRILELRERPPPIGHAQAPPPGSTP